MTSAYIESPEDIFFTPEDLGLVLPSNPTAHRRETRTRGQPASSDETPYPESRRYGMVIQDTDRSEVQRQIRIHNAEKSLDKLRKHTVTVQDLKLNGLYEGAIPSTVKEPVTFVINWIDCSSEGQSSLLVVYGSYARTRDVCLWVARDFQGTLSIPAFFLDNTVEPSASIKMLKMVYTISHEICGDRPCMITALPSATDSFWTEPFNTQRHMQRLIVNPLQAYRKHQLANKFPVKPILIVLEGKDPLGNPVPGVRGFIEEFARVRDAMEMLPPVKIVVTYGKNDTNRLNLDGMDNAEYVLR